MTTFETISKNNTVFFAREENYYGAGNFTVNVIAYYEGKDKTIKAMKGIINKLLNRNIFQRIFNLEVKQ